MTVDIEKWLDFTLKKKKKYRNENLASYLSIFPKQYITQCEKWVSHFG